MPVNKISKQGFTLIEVLISLLLSSTAIICFYTLQIKDQQLFVENLIQHEAQIQIFNARELILANPIDTAVDIQKILARVGTNPVFTMQIQNTIAAQFSLRNTWKSHLNSATAPSLFFSLLLLT